MNTYIHIQTVLVQLHTDPQAHRQSKKKRERGGKMRWLTLVNEVHWDRAIWQTLLDTQQSPDSHTKDKHVMSIHLNEFTFSYNKTGVASFRDTILDVSGVIKLLKKSVWTISSQGCKVLVYSCWEIDWGHLNYSHYSLGWKGQRQWLDAEIQSKGLVFIFSTTA